jgi:hypothetical protein
MKNLKDYNNYIKEYEVNNYVDKIYESLNSSYYKYEKSPIKGDSGEIQQFLIDMGIKVVDGKGGSTVLKKDWDFGKSTASAVWSYLYGSSGMVKSSQKYPQKKTVKELQTKLGVKSDGEIGSETLNLIAKKFNSIVKDKTPLCERLFKQILFNCLLKRQADCNSFLGLFFVYFFHLQILL